MTTTLFNELLVPFFSLVQVLKERVLKNHTERTYCRSTAGIDVTCQLIYTSVGILHGIDQWANPFEILTPPVAD